MSRSLFAEFLGTLFLVCTVVGSGIMAAGMANGPDASALLGTTLATAPLHYAPIHGSRPVSRPQSIPPIRTLLFLRP